MPSKIRVSVLCLLVFLVACQPAPAAPPQAPTATPPSQADSAPPPTASPTAEPEPTAGPTAGDPEPTPYPPAVEALVGRLQGLDLPTFFEVSFSALLARSPEGLVTDGLEAVFGVQEPLLDDISPAYRLETHQMMAAILEILATYDRAALSPADQLSYDVYQWYLQDQLAAWEFRLHGYPATFFPVTAVHEDLLLFLTDIHPVRDLQDGHNYLARLRQVSAKIDQLIANLEESQAAGITPPRFAIQWAVYGSLGEFVRNSQYQIWMEKIDNPFGRLQ